MFWSGFVDPVLITCTKQSISMFIIVSDTIYPCFTQGGVELTSV